MNIDKINFSLNLKHLENSALPLAIIDINKIIIWSNKSFNSFFGEQNLSGTNFAAITKLNFIDNYQHCNFEEIPLKFIGLDYLIRIIKIFDDTDKILFLIEIIPQNPIYLLNLFNNFSRALLNSDSQIYFYRSLLEQLNTCFENEKSIIISLYNNEVKEIIVSPNIQNNFDQNELKKILNSNLSILLRWFNQHKNIFICENVISNYGYQFNQILESEFVFISPCISENKIIGLIIFTKDENNLSELEIEIITNITNLLTISFELSLAKQSYKTIHSKLNNLQKFEIAGKLASGALHDFNNLLANIFGSISLLKNKLKSDLNLTKLLENIETSTSRARDLIKGILAIGKPLQNRKEIVFVDNVINELLKVITHSFPKSLKISYNIDNSLHKVVGNSTEIYQILLNLCINAKEAINNDGLISITAENFIIDDSNIFLYPFLNKGEYIKISVSDNGCGIEEEMLRKIFEPDFSTKQKETSSGLGLYITKQLVRSMNGYIDVESKLNQGTTFKLYFPSVTIKDQKIISSNEKIIMLADDEEVLNDLLGELLEANGYYILKVNNTNDVFRILNEEIKVDLIIIDYNLPEISGIECITKLRDIGFDIPVILASGAVDFKVDDITNTKINSIIQKPYSFEMILEIIKNLLNN